MPDSPTPEEREKKDKELKAKEAAEQAALPYKWTQTIKDVDVTVPVAGNLKGKDLDVKFTKKTLKVGVKGQEPIVDVRRKTNFSTLCHFKIKKSFPIFLQLIFALRAAHELTFSPTGRVSSSHSY